MFVRTINENEILPALHLVWEVYVSDVAPLLKPEAVEGLSDMKILLLVSGAARLRCLERLKGRSCAE